MWQIPVLLFELFGILFQIFSILAWLNPGCRTHGFGEVTVFKFVLTETCLHPSTSSSVPDIHTPHKDLPGAECTVCVKCCGGYSYNLMSFYPSEKFMYQKRHVHTLPRYNLSRIP